MTHRDKFKFVNELCSTMNRDMATIGRTRTTREHYAQRALRCMFPIARLWLVLILPFLRNLFIIIIIIVVALL